MEAINIKQLMPSAESECIGRQSAKPEKLKVEAVKSEKRSQQRQAIPMLSVDLGVLSTKTLRIDVFTQLKRRSHRLGDEEGSIILHL